MKERAKRRKDAPLCKTQDDCDLRIYARTTDLVKANEALAAEIAARKQAEEAVRRAFAYNRSLIEASLDPLVTIDGDGKITDVNAATERVTGCSRGELTGSDFSDYFTEPEQAKAGYRQVFKEGSVKDYALEIRHSDGHITPVLYNAALYHDETGRVLGVFAAARDITERKLAEAQIVLQNAVLNAINQVFLEALTCETEEMLCKKCLSTAEALTGSRFGIIAELNRAGRLDTIAMSDPGWSACRMAKSNAVLLLKDIELRGIFAKVMENEESAIINDPSSYPDRVGIPEGHPPLNSFLGVPLKQAGKAIGLIGLANKEGGFDIYDREAVETLAMAIVEALMRQRAESKIRRWNLELEQRVNERTAELEAANRELEAFTYSVSHDLRAPLRSINGFSRVLREDCAKLNAEEKDSLERIIGATRRMGQLIDDLLNLSRMSRAEMRRKRVNLSQIARGLAAKIREGQPGRQVDFVITENLVANGDEQLLTVALENLFNNAWKFTGKLPHAVIEFGRDREGGGKQSYFVRDNGAGFDMAYAEKLFNPFQRLHSIDEFPGTGIGLATVKRIVNRHGGRVWAEGEVGKGATIHFTL